MNAQEMFEKLGYLKQEENYEYIEYCRDILDKSTYGYIDSEIISFDYSAQNVYLTNKDNLNYEVVQCILKQMIEIGWNKC